MADVVNTHLDVTKFHRKYVVDKCNCEKSGFWQRDPTAGEGGKQELRFQGPGADGVSRESERE